MPDRPRTDWIRTTIALATPFIVAILLLLILIRLVGRDPTGTLGAIIANGFGSASALTETTVRMTPLLLCALAVAIPAKAGLLNIGAEGQLYCGAAGATAVALFVPWLPHGLVIPALICAALGAGAIWGLIPGFLRGWFKVNEVLVSLMLNYVAIYLVEYLVHGPWKDPSALGWPYSACFPEWAVLPTWGKTNIHLGLLLGLLAAGTLYCLGRTTTWGLAVSVIQSNPKTALYVGIGLRRYMVILFMLGGAMAGLAGLGEASVIQNRLRPGLSPGYGYSGFLIAWLAHHHFLAVVPVAFLVAGLYTGADALQLSAGLPSSSGDIFIGLVFLAVLIGEQHVRRRTAEGAV